MSILVEHAAPPVPARSHISKLLVALAIGFFYTLSAVVGLRFFVVQPEGVAAVWPASGVLLGALLLSQRRDWPLIVVVAGFANMLANLAAQNSPVVSLALALANLVEGVFTAYILRSGLGMSINMGRVRDSLRFIAIAVCCVALTAIIGAAVAQRSFGTPFWAAWQIWFIADALGILIITPAILCAHNMLAEQRRWLNPGRFLEIALLLLTLTVVAVTIFNTPASAGSVRLPYPLNPLLIWAALRFHSRGAISAALLLTAIVLVSTLHGLGPFSITGLHPTQQILNAQLYLALSICSSYVMAAVTSERETANHALRHSNERLASELEQRQRTEATLRESELRYRTVVDAISEGIVLQGADGSIITCNRAAERILGLSADQMAGRTSIDPHWRTVREDGSPFPGNDHPAMVALRTGSMQHDVVMGVHTPDDRLTWIAVNAEPLVAQPGAAPHAVVASFFDLTSRKTVEAQLQASLAEKEVLLKEIHHRVKNNLQVITSLLRLQASTSNDAEARAALLESKQRVHAMALVHEKLYQSRDLGRIDFASYTRSLVANLQRIHHLPGVQIQMQLDEIVLDIDYATTLGLVLNELIANSFKHAFPNGRAGTIVVRVLAGDSNGLKLIVGDDGIGLPSTFDPAQATSMGLQVLTILVAQLNGALSWQTTPGAHLALTIPERNAHV